MVILITGASRGIGRACAKLLVQNGNKVIANYNKSEDMALSLKEELRYCNGKIEIFKADVSKREDAHNLVEFALKTFGKIDILINNAGIAENKLFTDVTDEDWERVIKNNLYSVFCTTQEVLPNMINRKQGCIINISSIFGMIGASCESIYSIAKAGIDGMTKSLAKELGPSNIRVNSIAPGIIDTEMNSNLSKQNMQDIIKEIPLEKIGKPEDIAKCVNWLIEDEYTTGQIISPNGGWVI